MAANDGEMEIEMLQAIYMSELEVLDPSKLICEIKVLPNGAGSEDNEVAAYIKICMGEGYPDVEPEWVLRDAFGLSRAQIDELRDVVSAYILEHLGSQMVFGLVEVMREWLGERNVPAAAPVVDTIAKPQLSFEESEAALLAKLEEESKDPLIGGTIVTRESFEAWFNAYNDEMERNGTPIIPRKDRSALTGRQLFEQGMANDTTDLDE